MLAALAPTGYQLLPITGEHAAAAAKLPALHRDPFDRMLVAQAALETESDARVASEARVEAVRIAVGCPI